ncbi:MAG: SIS domain-containing protein [Anaerolineae bacterium]|nr:SIS domain-containing protein [Anaerolineae bacterium]
MNPPLEYLERRYPDLAAAIPAVETAYEALSATFQAGGKLLICGNGGSASDSDHIVGELMKSFELPRPIPDDLRQKLLDINAERGAYLADHLQRGLPAISLASHIALSTAINNDIAGDMSFAQQVLGYGKAGDTLIGISTSGNSANVLNALHVARARAMRTIGLSGRTGGKMRDLCDVLICVPYERTLEVQERHLAIYHVLCLMLEQEFFG